MNLTFPDAGSVVSIACGGGLGKRDMLGLEKEEEEEGGDGGGS